MFPDAAVHLQLAAIDTLSAPLHQMEVKCLRDYHKDEATYTKVLSLFVTTNTAEQCV